MVFTVAIIGAGVSGMVTAKICLEESTPDFPISVTVFEQTNQIGGLWRFRTEVQAGIGSCMEQTIVNSSKEMTAFSDFPVPERFPNFMHNKWMIKYLHSYASSFSFSRVVRFNHQVESITLNTRAPGYCVTVRDLSQPLESTKPSILEFDAVAICTGHNHTAKFPDTFPGHADYRGMQIHSHDFRNTEHFRGKRVVVVGVGNSSGDVAVELAPIAQQVYLSSRRGGTWTVRRTGPGGYPIDTLAQRRITESALNLLPYCIRCHLVQSLVQQSIGHRLLGLKPESTLFYSQHVMVNDYLPTTIHLGQVRIKPNIQRFTPNGVLFEGDLSETPCDAVIFGTGYRLSFPFLDKSLVDWNPNGRIKLYKHVFDPTQPQPERLAFIGLTQPIGSLPPIAEIQARWFVGLITGKCRPLASPSQMHREIDRRRARIVARYGPENEHRYTFQCDWLPYMDSVARSASMKPQLWKHFFRDPQLWWALLTDPAIPAQFRLQGPGAKPKLARQLILTTKDRIKGPYKDARMDL